MRLRFARIDLVFVRACRESPVTQDDSGQRDSGSLEEGARRAKRTADPVNSSELELISQIFIRHAITISGRWPLFRGSTEGIPFITQCPGDAATDVATRRLSQHLRSRGRENAFHENSYSPDAVSSANYIFTNEFMREISGTNVVIRPTYQCEGRAKYRPVKCIPAFLAHWLALFLPLSPGPVTLFHRKFTRTLLRGALDGRVTRVVR